MGLAAQRLAVAVLGKQSTRMELGAIQFRMGRTVVVKLDDSRRF